MTAQGACLEVEQGGTEQGGGGGVDTDGVGKRAEKRGSGQVQHSKR